ncbi:MAG: hypothetical protein LC737_07430 [Chloroflexi bacterium]|nr:hypothetical protein [Chloroflexota bacterium]
MKRWLSTMLVALCVWSVSACGAAPSATPAQTVAAAQVNKPTVALLAPSDGAQVNVGSELSVESSARDARGVVRVELWVDGILYRVDVTRDPEGLQSLSVTQKWVAKDAGAHTLMVKALNRDGAASDGRTVHITVVGQGTPAADATPTRAGTLAPGALAVSFVISRTVIPYGDCTGLRWDVDNAVTVKLDGRAVATHDSRQVCPINTTDYTLEATAQNPSDSMQKQLSLEVKAPNSVGTGLIASGKSVDLDGGTADVLTNALQDFKWDGRIIQPKNNATFALVGVRGFNEAQQDDCQKATNYSDAPLASLTTGALICFKTNGGRMGKLRVESADGDLKMKWVTW